MSDIGEVGLDSLLARLGRGRPPEILEATAQILERGHHLAMLAADGSGRETVYALAALRRCDPAAEGVQGLFLAATDEVAARLGRVLHAACAPVGLAVFVAGPGWAERAGFPAAARLVVARPSRVLPAIRGGRLGLGALRVVGIDGVSSQVALGEWPSAEPILDTLGPDTCRIASSDRPDAEFLSLIERRMPRARRWPGESFPPAAGDDAPRPTATLRVGLAAGEERLSAAEACVADASAAEALPLRIHCLGTEEARAVAAALGAAGHHVRLEGSLATVLDGPADATGGEEAGSALVFGLPDGLAPLVEALGGAERRYAVVDPAHSAQLDLLAARAGLAPVHLVRPAILDEMDAISRYRARLRAATKQADVVAEILVLEPLLEEFGAVRLAATLSELLRQGEETGGTTVPWPDIEAASVGPARAAGEAAGSRGRRGARDDRRDEPPRGARSSWSRLYMGIGKRDEIRPGDLVGALTGEAGIAGGQIGKIEIRGGFSLVEIDSQAVDEVVRKMQGVTIRGQPVVVRLDRGG